MGREMATTSGQSYGALDDIAERLSRLPDLYLPHSFSAGRSDQQVTNEEKKDHLLALLHRDAAIFLERYGRTLQLHELTEFETLKGDYEVDWHLRQLRASLSPSEQQQKSKAKAVKNRRLAFMEKLVEGEYFSEEAMRMRRPLLHHEYVGQFQDPSTWASFQRRGDKLADVLIRQSEEAFIQQKLEDERIKAEEEEEDDDDEDEDDHDREAEDPELHRQELNSFSCLQLSEDKPSNNNNNNNNGASMVEESQTSDIHQQQQDKASIMQQHMCRQAKRLAGEPDLRLEQFTREIMAKFLAAEDDDDPNKPSQQELDDKLDDFTRVMQEKFLSGEDSEHVDYSSIDQNASLDDHWLREVSREAEEKYFADC